MGSELALLDVFPYSLLHQNPDQNPWSTGILRLFQILTRPEQMLQDLVRSDLEPKFSCEKQLKAGNGSSFYSRISWNSFTTRIPYFSMLPEWTELIVDVYFVKCNTHLYKTLQSSTEICGNLKRIQQVSYFQCEVGCNVNYRVKEKYWNSFHFSCNRCCLPTNITFELFE